MSTVGARVWPWVPGMLLASMLAGLGTLAAIATNDPGFALERDYYRKAVHYDRELEQRGESARLAFQLDAKLSRNSTGESGSLVVTARDARGPVTGARVTVEALENAHASTVFDLTLVESSPGTYGGTLPALHTGVWELRFCVERDGERFTEVVRKEVLRSDR